MSSLMENCESLRHRHDFRGDLLLSPTVTSGSLAGINGPLRQLQNDSSMRVAMESRASPLSVLPRNRRRI